MLVYIIIEIKIALRSITSLCQNSWEEKPPKNKTNKNEYLIKFKYLKNDIEKKQKVGIELLNTNRIIANNFIILSFMQKDKVDLLNKVFGRKVSIGIYDGDTLISDEKVLILDSIDDKISSREASAQLNLKNMRYDLYKRYQLKITDLEDEEIIEEYDFNIRFNNF